MHILVLLVWKLITASHVDMILIAGEIFPLVASVITSIMIMGLNVCYVNPPVRLVRMKLILIVIVV